MADLARCETLHDVTTRSGQRALLIGTYREVDLRMRQRPPAVYDGHVAIGLRDGADVLLEPSWSERSIRSAEERSRYAGVVVEVNGVVHDRTPPPPELIAYVTDACISAVADIRACGEENESL